MRSKLLIAFLALPLMAAPATAQQNSSTTEKAAKPKEKQYCFKLDGSTGSRVKSTVCQTKAQWAREGVDVDAYVK